MKETSIKSEGNEGSRSNSETFSNGSGGVTSGIKSISSLSDVWVEFRHFSDSSSVITNGSISVNSEREWEVSKHTDSGKGNSIVSEEIVSKIGSDGNEDSGKNCGEVSQSEAEGDV